MNNMLGYLRDYKRESVLAPLFKMLEATFDLFVPLVMADIVNVGIAAHDLHYILVRCGILLVLAVIGLTCSLTAQYFSAKAAVGYSTALRHALFAHIQSLSFSEMDTLGTSTLITRMTSDINQVQSGLNLFLRLFLRSPFVVIGAMVMAFTVNARAALIFVVAIPLLSVVVFGVMVITRPLYKTAQVRLDRVLGLTRENLTGVRVVRAFDKEQDEIDRFENANDLLTRMQLHVGHLSALMSPLTYVIINIAIVALLYVGSIEINVGGMASGDVIALVNYMNQILIELVKLANLIVQVSKALACAGRVQAVLDTKPGMDFPVELRSEVPVDKAGDAVRFDHVSLTYAGAGAPSLSDISFTAKRGQTIGVIGGTGSGKSSLVNLIPRFYDATEGTVEILGRPAADYPREALRGKVNVVMQKAQLFGGTIRSNLLWGNKNATDTELWAALETAQAAEFVQAKPLGLDEPVEQGGRNLSGGQKQRLTIARALVGKPDILILDEPLSGVEFLLTDSSGHYLGNDNGRFATNAVGEILVDGLEPGMTVIAREVRAKTGYLLDDSPQHALIKSGETAHLQFLNQPAGNLIIRKVSSGPNKEPLEGVEFKITYADGSFVPDANGELSSNGIYYTNKSGEIRISGIVGTVVATETKTIPGFTIDEATRTQTVVVNPNDTQTLTFYNKPTTTLILQKYISGTKNEPLAGVQFLVTDSSGAVVGPNNGYYTTDAAGQIVIEGLTDGMTVTAKEVKSVDGFVLDGTPQSIKIDQSQSPQRLTFWNERQGALIINKLSSLDRKTPLEGVTFKITTATGEFVPDENGKISSNGLYYTDENGQIILKGVTGTLVVTEEKSISGYTIDENTRTQTVVVNPNDTQSLYFVRFVP